MNIVMIDRILELSETRSKFEKLKQYMSNWRYVAITSIGFLTAKVAAEQLVMLLRK